MRRKVKAWVIISTANQVAWYRGGAHRSRDQARMALVENGHLLGERVVPCVITFDDGRPAKRARGKK